MTWPVAAVVGTGLAMTLLAAAYTYRMDSAIEQARFERAAQSLHHRISVGMDSYAITLRACRGLFVPGRTVPAAEFRRFVASLDVNRYFPGAQGIGYAPYIPADDLPRQLERIRREQVPAFQIRPSGRRPAYVPILYLEPLDRYIQPALGFDMAADPIRRDAMDRAAARDEAVVSGKVTLVQDAATKPPTGFLMYVPVYVPAGKAAAPSRHLQGFIFSPFRSGDLFGSVLRGLERPWLEVDVYDGPRIAAEHRLYTNHPGGQAGAQPPRPAYSQVQRLQVAGRTWSLQVAARPGLGSARPYQATSGVFFGGLLITALLGAISLSQSKAKEAERRRRLRTEFLAQAGSLLSASLDYETTLANVAHLVVPQFADWCTVDILDPGGRICRMAIVHRDPARLAKARELHQRYPPTLDNRPVLAKVLTSGQPELYAEVPAEAMDSIAQDDHHRQLLQDLGISSMMIVPLTARQSIIGAISFVNGASSPSFGPDDLTVAESLAARAAIAVDNARLYQAAVKSQHDAEAAVQVRDDFLAIASHELRTPLTTLQLHVEGILRRARQQQRDGMPLPEWLQKKLEQASRQTMRLTGLIKAILDVSRITAGRLAVRVEAVDLAAVVHGTLDRFQDQIAAAGCQISVTAAAGVVGRWDRRLLDQIVDNLLSNAIKYGRGRPVEIVVAADWDTATLTVRDQGIGIAPGDRSRIFDRFERAVPATHYGGLGIGLWLVKQDVTVMGGTIDVESAPAAGTTFRVRLPLASSLSQAG